MTHQDNEGQLMRTVEQVSNDLNKAREQVNTAQKQVDMYSAELNEIYQAVMRAMQIGTASA